MNLFLLFRVRDVAHGRPSSERSKQLARPFIHSDAVKVFNVIKVFKALRQTIDSSTAT